MFLDTVRRYVVALRVSRMLGQVKRLREARRAAEALKVAHNGLDLLRQPVVRGGGAAEGALLVALTVNVEQIAQELALPGAARVDIRGALAVLRESEPGGEEARNFRAHWLPYLEAKAAGAEVAAQ
jgi:predicted metal-dependent hydrolase